MHGVMNVIVGYSGGIGRNPTYQSIKDHTEAVRIEYDPNLITYANILEEMMSMHSPKNPAYSRQYRSVILVHNDNQRKIAEETVKLLSKSLGGVQIYTDIENAVSGSALAAFYRAEEYHQKYLEKQNQLALYKQML